MDSLFRTKADDKCRLKFGSESVNPLTQHTPVVRCFFCSCFLTDRSKAVVLVCLFICDLVTVSSKGFVSPVCLVLVRVFVPPCLVL